MGMMRSTLWYWQNRLGHISTDPACAYHHAPRGKLTRWWFDFNRGRQCGICIHPPLT